MTLVSKNGFVAKRRILWYKESEQKKKKKKHPTRKVVRILSKRINVKSTVRVKTTKSGRIHSSVKTTRGNVTRTKNQITNR